MTPLTREESYLARTAGDEVEIPVNPQSRVEHYLAKIAGEDVPIPTTPQTKIEHYLAKIVENGGGGNGTVIIEGGITCTDDGEGNITITEDEE